MAPGESLNVEPSLCTGKEFQFQSLGSFQTGFPEWIHRYLWYLFVIFGGLKSPLKRAVLVRIVSCQYSSGLEWIGQSINQHFSREFKGSFAAIKGCSLVGNYSAVGLLNIYFQDSTEAAILSLWSWFVHLFLR